jgi:hypothetical protein
MTDFATLFQQGNGWFFIPSAILLGALHGLEPGHSKTMMAAFIVAIKGTVKQAVMLGLRPRCLIRRWSGLSRWAGCLSAVGSLPKPLSRGCR